MPTLSPRSRKASARLTATVDLPTPPFPEATAIIAATPGMPARAAGPCVAPPAAAPARGGGDGCGGRGAAAPPPAARSAVSATITERTPGTARTAFSAFARTLSHALTFAASTVMEQNILPSVTRMSESLPLCVSGAPSGVGTAASFASTSSLSDAIFQILRTTHCLDRTAKRQAQLARHLFVTTGLDPSYSSTPGLTCRNNRLLFPLPLRERVVSCERASNDRGEG